MSHVTHHTSHVTRHKSHVTRHLRPDLRSLGGSDGKLVNLMPTIRDVDNTGGGGLWQMCCPPTSSSCLPHDTCSTTAAVRALTEAIAALKRCSRRQRAREGTGARGMRCKQQRGCELFWHSCFWKHHTWYHINTPEYFAAAARILCTSISSASSSQTFRKCFAPGKQGVHGDEIRRKMEGKIWREI